MTNKKITIISQCHNCIHFNWDIEFTCMAFPNGIPDKIIYDEVSHTNPYRNDGGIRFEKDEEI